MSYLTQAQLASDEHIARRVTACAASEHIENPEGFAYQHKWALSAQPGWDAAYASAIAANKPDPGADSSVISDGIILAAVQLLKPDPA